MEPTNQVKWWIDTVSTLEDVVEELRKDYQLLPDDIINAYRLSKHRDEALSEVRNLKEKSDFPKLAEELVQVRFEQVPSSSAAVKMDKFTQLEKLMEDCETGLIGIYGMAGVGKTALLSKFNNDLISRRTPP